MVRFTNSLTRINPENVIASNLNLPLRGAPSARRSNLTASVLTIIVFISVVTGFPPVTHAFDAGHDQAGNAGNGLGGSSFSGNEPTVTGEEARLLQEVAALSPADRPEAISSLRRALNDESSAALDFALAGLLFQENLYGQSERAYLEAIEKLPGFGRAWYQLGLVRLKLDRPVEAAAALRASIKNDRRPDAALWKLLGYCYFVAENLVPAEFAYRQALVLEPGDREAGKGLARALLEGERYREALVMLKKLCVSDPLTGELWALRAGAHLELGQPGRALAVLECAGRLQVLDPEARLTQGDLYFNQGLIDQAVSCYDHAFAAGKLSGQRAFHYAEALYRAGELDSAQKYLLQAGQRGLKEKSAGFLLGGRIALDRGDQAAARREFEAAVNADPLNGEALLALGEVLWLAEEYEAAALTMERASRVKGHQVQAFVQLARMEVERERYAAAVKYLESSQELEPDVRVERYLEQVRRLVRTDRER